MWSNHSLAAFSLRLGERLLRLLRIIDQNNVGAASGQHTTGAGSERVALTGLQTSFSDEREQPTSAMALANSRWVPKGLHDRAVKPLGHVVITDVITLMG